MRKLYEFPGANEECVMDIPMLHTEDGRYIHYAQWYGYPACCHNAFWFDQEWLLKPHSELEKKLGFIGTGYRVCPSCQQKTAGEIYEYICNNRFSDLPFPLQEEAFDDNGKLSPAMYRHVLQFMLNMDHAGVSIRKSLIDIMNNQTHSHTK